jgi:tRNA A-37 threonylcarbamoyl transferase component Bud32
MTEATRTEPTRTGEEAPTVDLTGRTVGDFHILRRLGRGGMGEVYLAEQRSLKRKVALKILRSDLAANPTALKRFKQEALAVAQATHANIVQVYACDEADGVTYMALEYVEGRNLKEYLTKKGPPNLLLAISFMRQVAAALQRAAELGIIHRDIKPENILLTRKGEVKVADFGLSRVLGDGPPVNLTQSGITMGTPLYMAPEQVESKPVDARTDIYSFGVTCYHMMAGEPPFTGSNAFEVALAHVRTEPEPLQVVRPDLPEAFCAVVHKMMAKDPADRYQTCRELLRDLAKVRESLSGTPTAVPLEEPGVELLPLDEPEEVVSATAPGTATPRPLPATAALPALRRHWVAAVLFALVPLTVLLALGFGAALAWVTYVWQGQPKAAVPAADKGPPDRDALLSAKKREQALRDLAEPYLNKEKASDTPTAGFVFLMELGLFYLQQDRLDDAQELFKKLDDMRQVESYHILGHVGRGIVLALRDQATESNRLFKDAFTPQRFPVPDGSAKGVPKRGEPQLQIVQNAQMKYWLAEAIHYNERNGVARRDMPQPLLRIADPGATKPKP